MLKRKRALRIFEKLDGTEFKTRLGTVPFGVSTVWWSRVHADVPGRSLPLQQAGPVAVIEPFGVCRA